MNMRKKSFLKLKNLVNKIFLLIIHYSENELRSIYTSKIKEFGNQNERSEERI